jgi:hypothetical protein
VDCICFPVTFFFTHIVASHGLLLLVIYLAKYKDKPDWMMWVHGWSAKGGGHGIHRRVHPRGSQLLQTAIP